jgi:catechol 2,3-dioxygenase-like lactoylglutathione lyase family enzyme
MIKGIDWILCPTDSFDETTAFVRDVLGLTPEASGVPATDRQFTRYAQFTAPDRTTLEIVEPTPAARPRYRGPVVCLTVDDLAGARAELARKGAQFVTPVITAGDGWGWTYLRALDGQVFQIHGPWSAPD